MKDGEGSPAITRKGETDMKNLEMYAQFLDGRREALSEPEFVGEGLHSLDDAVSAARDAMDYCDGRIEYVDLYDGEEYLGYVDDFGKFHEDLP